MAPCRSLAPLGSRWARSGGKFIVSMTGEAYDRPGSGQNWKFWLTAMSRHEGYLLSHVRRSSRAHFRRRAETRHLICCVNSLALQIAKAFEIQRFCVRKENHNDVPSVRPWFPRRVRVDNLCFFLVCTTACAAVALPDPAVDESLARQSGQETAVLAGGCFWGMHLVFDHVKGVRECNRGIFRRICKDR